MKHRFGSFLAGAVATALVASLTFSAIAISGRMTIEVDPINVQVNGEIFAPTDVNGEAVPVFAYAGTTYAPLRALAEAYGLEVGYDAASNMATVSDPAAPITPAPDTASVGDSTGSAEDDAKYQEFKGMWESSETAIPQDDKVLLLTATQEEFLDFANSVGEDELKEMIRKLDDELYKGDDNQYLSITYVVRLNPRCAWGDILNGDNYTSFFDFGKLKSEIGKA